jgi:hypothetical protein
MDDLQQLNGLTRASLLCVFYGQQARLPFNIQLNSSSLYVLTTTSLNVFGCSSPPAATAGKKFGLDLLWTHHCKSLGLGCLPPKRSDLHVQTSRVTDSPATILPSTPGNMAKKLGNRGISLLEVRFLPANLELEGMKCLQREAWSTKLMLC